MSSQYQGRCSVGIRNISLRLSYLLTLTLIFTFLPALSSANAVIIGKTQIFPASYPIDNAGVASSVGIYKKNPSGRIGTPITFVPYYFLAQNKGIGGNLVTANYYATLAYSVRGPDGKDINLPSYTQDILGTGVVTQDPTKQVIQTASTNGAAVVFIPELTGTYTVTLWHDFNEDGKQTTGEIPVVAYFVISADIKPTVSYTTYGNAVGGLAADSIGSLAKVCITNNSQIAGLNWGEGFVVTSDSATEVIDSVSKWVNGAYGMLDDPNTNSYNLTSENFGSNGCAYLNHFNTDPAPGSVKLTFTGFGDGFAGQSFSMASSYISKTDFPITPSFARVVTNDTNLNGSYSTSSTETAAASGQSGTDFEIGTPINVATTVTLSTTKNASTSILFRVVDTDGKITGLKGATYMGAGATFNTAVTYSAYAQLDRNESYLIYVQGTDSLESGNVTGTVAVKVKSQDRFAKYMVGNPGVIRSKVGGTTTVYLQVKDQFNALLAGAPVAPIISGRNSNDGVFPYYLTDSYGRVSWSWKDNSTNPNIFVDTITGKDMFGQNLIGAGLTINYAPYQAAASAKFAGGASEDKGTEYTRNFIDTSYAGAANTTVQITATLFDASGNTLPAGVRVNWSTKGLDSKTFIPTDSISGTDFRSTYTDSLGQAITYVYSLGVGDVDVFASVDDFTSTNSGKIHFANAPTDVRYVSAITTEGWIKAYASDRYGNPVAGVDISVARVSGDGYIPGISTTKINGITDREGVLEVAVTGGNAVFEVKTMTDNFGQTASKDGFVNGTSISSGSAGGNFTSAGVTRLTLEVKSRNFEAEALAANVKAIEATAKSLAASEDAANRADIAIAEALKVQEKINALSRALSDMSIELNKKLLFLLSVIAKIQKKIS